VSNDVLTGRAGLQSCASYPELGIGASHLAMRGVSLKVIQELLRHATITMTMRYAHLAPEVSRDAVLLLDNTADVRPSCWKGLLRRRVSKLFERR
jgi:hypothetical protein